MAIIVPDQQGVDLKPDRGSRIIVRDTYAPPPKSDAGSGAMEVAKALGQMGSALSGLGEDQQNKEMSEQMSQKEYWIDQVRQGVGDRQASEADVNNIASNLHPKVRARVSEGLGLMNGQQWVQQMLEKPPKGAMDSPEGQAAFFNELRSKASQQVQGQPFYGSGFLQGVNSGILGMGARLSNERVQNWQANQVNEFKTRLGMGADGTAPIPGGGSGYSDVPPAKTITKGKYQPSADDATYLKTAAEKAGYDPVKLAAIISYESGFQPDIWGGKNGKYYGLIQFGGPEREAHKVIPGQSDFKGQVDSAIDFLKTRGYKPGMSLREMYATVNGGNPGAAGTLSDGNGTINSHSMKIASEHIPRAVAFLSKVGMNPTQQQEAKPPGFTVAGYDPAKVYDNIPDVDGGGRPGQREKFRQWNSDPVGNHEKNLATVNPNLQSVIRKAQADNPDLKFVVASGARDAEKQAKAKEWGWSKAEHSHHEDGSAADIWVLDKNGKVIFDKDLQGKAGAAIKKAAADMGAKVTWGGDWKNKDLPHVEWDHGQPDLPKGASPVQVASANPGKTATDAPAPEAASLGSVQPPKRPSEAELIQSAQKEAIPTDHPHPDLAYERPEILRARENFVGLDKEFQASSSLQNAQRRDAGFDWSVDKALKERDPAWLKTIPPQILTPDQREKITSAQVQIQRLKEHEYSQSKMLEKDAYDKTIQQGKVEILGNLVKGDKIDPAKYFTHPELFEYAMKQKDTDLRLDPSTSGFNRMNLATEIDKAGSTGNWQRLGFEGTPSVKQLSDMIETHAGMNSTDKMALRKDLDKLYAGAFMGNRPDVSQAYQHQVKPYLDAYLASVGGQVGKLLGKDPILPAVENAYLDAVKRKASAKMEEKGTSDLTRTDMDPIIKESVKEAIDKFKDLKDNKTPTASDAAKEQGGQGTMVKADNAPKIPGMIAVVDPAKPGVVKYIKANEAVESTEESKPKPTSSKTTEPQKVVHEHNLNVALPNTASGGSLPVFKNPLDLLKGLSVPGVQQTADDYVPEPDKIRNK